jgi:hypothetical protein
MRKVIQLAVVPCSETTVEVNGWGLYALCDDGTMWYRHDEDWQSIDPVPGSAQPKRRVRPR